MQTELEKANYRIKPQQLEQLARDHLKHERGAAMLSGTYLKCLVAAVKELAGPTKDEQLETIEAIHGEYLPHLEKGVSVGAKGRIEVNRRLTFARTAKTELRGYIAAGGPLVDLDPHAVTKTMLRAVINAQRQETERPEGIIARTAGAKRLEVSAMVALERVQRAIEQIAQQQGEPVDTVFELLAEMQGRLTDLSDRLGQEASKAQRVKQVDARQGERKGELRVWPH